MSWLTQPHALVPVPAMLRTSITQTSEHSATLHLEGELVGAWIAELSATCDHLLKSGHTLTLDLGGVSSIGREGFAYLVSLSERGVFLTGCSPFQREHLRQIAVSR
jgi:ABC-type transporter Mla MlaB component